jgi:hypothetical protein
MNSFLDCHGEERSDVAIHRTFFVDCRSRQASFGMTNLSSLERSDDPIQLGRHDAQRAF